jgi:hypothetical protein
MVTDRQKLAAAAFFAALCLLLVVYALVQDATSFAESAKRIEAGRTGEPLFPPWSLILLIGAIGGWIYLLKDHD